MLATKTTSGAMPSSRSISTSGPPASQSGGSSTSLGRSLLSSMSHSTSSMLTRYLSHPDSCTFWSVFSSPLELCSRWALDNIIILNSSEITDPILEVWRKRKSTMSKRWQMRPTKQVQGSRQRSRVMDRLCTAPSTCCTTLVSIACFPPKTSNMSLWWDMPWNFS
jgi:hypothetical protein